MKIASPSISRKRIIIASMAAILLLGGAAAVLERMGVTDFIKSSPVHSGPTAEQEEEQKRVEQQAKQEFIESPDPTPSETEASAASIELTAKQEANGSVTVLTKLYDVANGTCTLSITNGNQSYNKSAAVIYQPTFSSCAGFSVQKAELGPGDWVIKLAVRGNESLEKMITLGVD